MKTETTWLDSMFAHSDALKSIAFQISDLARAFERTGNEHVSSELFQLAKEVKAQADNTRALTGSKIDADYRDAVASSANILRALVAGAEVAKR
jgi:hypothetical protein